MWTIFILTLLLAMIASVSLRKPKYRELSYIPLSVKGYNNKKMEDDDHLFDERAAPTRKHKFIQEPLVSGLDPNENENAEEVIQNVTGKRFSLTQLLKRKSKKDDINKDDSNKDGSNKGDSNKEETNAESSTETKEKQIESKSDS